MQRSSHRRYRPTRGAISAPYSRLYEPEDSISASDSEANSDEEVDRLSSGSDTSSVISYDSDDTSSRTREIGITRQRSWSPSRGRYPWVPLPFGSISESHVNLPFIDLLSESSEDIARAKAPVIEQERPIRGTWRTFEILPSHYPLTKKGKWARDSTTDYSLHVLEREGINRIGSTVTYPDLPQVFLWTHLQCEKMDFEVFKDGILRCQFDDADANDLKSLLESVEEKQDQPLQTNDGKGRYMKPTVKMEPKLSDGEHPTNSSNMWFCLPFIHLKAYNSSRLPDGSTCHPIWGLLQFKFNDATNANFYDDHQMIRKETKTESPENEPKYFQIDQLWGILIGRKLLFTCSRISADELVPKPCNVRRMDQPDMAAAKNLLLQTNGLRVRGYENRIWLLDAHKCESWMEFVAHFQTTSTGYSGTGFHFVLQEGNVKRMIDENDWEEVKEIAKTRTVELFLVGGKFKRSSLKYARSVSAMPNLLFEPLESASNEMFNFSVFRVFPWMISRHMMSENISTEVMNQKLHNISNKASHEWATFLDNPHLDDETSRGRDSSKKFEDVKAYMDDLNARFRPENDHSGEYTARDDLSETKVELFNDKRTLYQSASILVGFFFPKLNPETGLTNHFWNAVYLILTERNPRTDIHDLSRHLKELAEDCTDAQRHFSPNIAPKPHQLQTSPRFAHVWLMLQKGLTLAASPKIRFKAVKTSLKHAKSFMERACQETSKSHCSVVVRRQLEAVLPIGLVGIITDHLVHDVTQHDGDYVRTKYRIAIDDLNVLIHALDTGNRAHDEAISRLGLEVEVLEDAFKEQHDIVQKLIQCSSKDYDTLLSGHPLASGLENEIMGTTAKFLRGRLRDFGKFEEELLYLRDENARRVDMRKDFQDTISILFGVIGTVFLPWTMVASYLGMNTADIRDMKSRQWVFWAASIPLFLVTGLAFVLSMPSNKTRDAVKSTPVFKGRRARKTNRAKGNRLDEEKGELTQTGGSGRDPHSSS